jgi:hypothetical protein
MPSQFYKIHYLLVHTVTRLLKAKTLEGKEAANARQHHGKHVSTAKNNTQRKDCGSNVFYAVHAKATEQGPEEIPPTWRYVGIPPLQPC